MKQREAYKGPQFTIEWYFDEKEKSQALDYFLGLSLDRQRRALRLFRFLGELGLLRDLTKFRNEGDGIYAFKPQPERFLCFFFKGKRVIITNAFEKKQDKLPPNEKARALKAKEDYEKRVREGTYYE